MKYLIVDDEHMAHDIIKDYCDLLPNLELMKQCYDALEAIEYLNKNKVDLIFLDLNMPKLKGFEFLRTLSVPPKIIVTTAYKEHALEGYELSIVDYLLKPFSFERFLKAVNKVASSSNEPSSGYIGVGNSIVKSIFLRSNKKYIQVLLNKIQYVEAAGNYSKVITTDETVTVREKISDLLKMLPEDGFLRIHKSFAVAKEHIKSMEGNRMLIGDQIVPIGTTYRARVLDLLN